MLMMIVWPGNGSLYFIHVEIAVNLAPVAMPKNTAVGMGLEKEREIQAHLMNGHENCEAAKKSWPINKLYSKRSETPPPSSSSEI